MSGNYVPPHRRQNKNQPVLQPITSAGLVVFNRDNNTVLVGRNNGGYGLHGNGYQRPDESWRNIDNIIYNNVNPTKELLPDADVIANLPNNTPINQTGRPTIFHFINELYNERLLTSCVSGNEEYHVVDNNTGFRIYQKGANISEGFPKGGREPNENLVQTAIREFNEETGFNIANLVGFNILENSPPPNIPIETLPLNTLYDIGVNDRYQYYFIIINNNSAQDILNHYYGVTANPVPIGQEPELFIGCPALVPVVPGQAPWNPYIQSAIPFGLPNKLRDGHRYNSELYDLRFITINTIPFTLDQSSFGIMIPIRNYLNNLPVNSGPITGGYYQKLQKYQTKLDNR